MAKQDDKRVVWMVLGARGPGGIQYPPRTRQVVPALIGRQLIRDQKAVPYEIPPQEGVEPAAPPPEPRELTTAIPPDFPHREQLEDAGFVALADVPRTLGDLIEVPGIGPTRARRILAALDDGEE